jgi:predicted ATPase
VASAVGVREQPGQPIAQTLLDYLRTRTLLLVLDNCEHLVAACASLAEMLLRDCPGLRILATSREGLGIAGETTWRVPSLSMPDVQQRGSGAPELAAILPQYEAVRLFIDRALAVAPGFAVTNENAPSVAQICHRLDGIPLALELAAARIRVLTPEQIAARLDDRLRLLTGGSRTALPRQQTLRALVDWSYDLLSEPERVVLGRLSVFLGGWTLEAAEAVCAGDGIEDVEVLDLLAQLVDKSIVVAESRGDATRYRLLESIREYGTEKLAATGQARAVRRRHRDWFMQYVEDQVKRLHGVGQAVAFGLLNAEYDNIRAALDWSITEPGELDVAVRLADLLSWFWVMRGSLHEGREWLDLLLRLAAEPNQTRAQALIAAGYVAHHTGDYDWAALLLDQGVTLWRQVGGPRQIAVALAQFGRLEQSRGDLDRAWSLLTESRSLFEQTGGEVVFDAPLAVFLAQIAKDRGDHERAIPLFEECLQRARAEGDLHTASSVLRSLGELTERRGDPAQAGSYFAESLRLILQLKDYPCAVTGLNALAHLGAAQGELVFAVRLLAAAESIREAIGYVVAPGLLARRDQAIERIRDRLNSAQFDAAWRAGGGMTMEAAIAYALETPTSTR